MMMEIKCAIVDDEPFARKGLASYIAKIDFLKLVVECEDAIELSLRKVCFARLRIGSSRLSVKACTF